MFLVIGVPGKWAGYLKYIFEGVLFLTKLLAEARGFDQYLLFRMYFSRIFLNFKGTSLQILDLRNSYFQGKLLVASVLYKFLAVLFSMLYCYTFSLF